MHSIITLATKFGRLGDLKPIDKTAYARFPTILQSPGARFPACSNTTQGSTTSSSNWSSTESSYAEDDESFEDAHDLTLESIIDKYVVAAPLIHSLPPELLMYIFSRANDRCIYDKKSDNYSAQTGAMALTGVCAYWRKLALATPALWTHIDLVLDRKLMAGAHTRMQYLLRRAGNTPISVHICEPKSTPDLDTSMAKRFLIQNAHRIGSLDVTLVTPLYDLFLASLVCVREGSAAGVLRAWRIRNENTFRVLYVDTKDRSVRYLTPLNHIDDERLRSLRVLHLNTVFIRWDSLAYYGLVDLQIEWLPTHLCPTLVQLVAVFSASPRLRILTLSDISIKLENNKPSPPPVYLECLEELNLLEISTVDLCDLLSVISPGPRRLSLSMRLDDKPETIQTVMSFFDHSNIVRLCVNGYSVKDRLPVLLCRLPKLCELVLQNYEISQQEFFDLKTAKQMIADNLTLWPQLQAWHLLNCRIDWDALCGMVCTHNLTKLRLRDCYLDPVWPSNEDRDLGLLVEVLGEVVPDIQCSRISSERTGGLAPK